MTPVRTVERGYHAVSGRRAGQVRRVHVVREEGPRRWSGDAAHRQTWCGQSAWNGRGSVPLFREPPHPLPEGLAWCPSCIGHLAEQLGRLGEVARLLGVEAPATGKHACCQHCEHFGDDESYPDNHAEPCPEGCNDNA